MVLAGLPERGWLWQGPLRPRRLPRMALTLLFLKPLEDKVGAMHQKHRRALGEIQVKGFLRRRCWKLLDSRDPFPGAQYGPGHTAGAQQTRVQQRCLVPGHPSAHGHCGETEERAILPAAWGDASVQSK